MSFIYYHTGVPSMQLVSCSKSVVDNVKIFLFSEYRPSDLVQNYFLTACVNSFMEL